MRRRRQRDEDLDSFLACLMQEALETAAQKGMPREEVEPALTNAFEQTLESQADAVTALLVRKTPE